MKKIIKSRIFSFILGAVIFSSITYAYTYSAKQISFTPSDNTWNVSNVESALNDLKGGFKPVFGTAQYNQSLGDRIATRNGSINLTKGKYLLEVVTGFSIGSSGINNSTTDLANEITCDSTTKKQLLSGKRNQAIGSKYGIYSIASIYYIEVVKENDTISSSSNTTVNSEYGQFILLSAIPMN